MICDYCGGQCKMGTPQTLSVSCLTDLDADKRRLDWLDDAQHWGIEEIHSRWCQNIEPFDIRGTIDALMTEEQRTTTVPPEDK